MSPKRLELGRTPGVNRRATEIEGADHKTCYQKNDAEADCYAIDGAATDNDE
jgi:hypothetical protein